MCWKGSGSRSEQRRVAQESQEGKGRTGMGCRASMGWDELVEAGMSERDDRMRVGMSWREMAWSGAACVGSSGRVAAARRAEAARHGWDRPVGMEWGGQQWIGEVSRKVPGSAGRTWEDQSERVDQEKFGMGRRSAPDRTDWARQVGKERKVPGEIGWTSRNGVIGHGKAGRNGMAGSGAGQARRSEPGGTGAG